VIGTIFAGQMFDKCACDAKAEQIYVESLTRLAAVLESHGETYKLGVPFSPRQPKEKEPANIIRVDRRKSFTRTILVDSCARALRLTPPKKSCGDPRGARTAWHAHSVRCLIARTLAPPDLPSSYAASEAQATHTWLHQLGLRRGRATLGLRQAIGDRLGEVGGLTSVCPHFA
jgi:hypothetical protein